MVADQASSSIIGLYGFGYVPSLTNGYSSSLKSCIYIDSYAQRNLEVEQYISLTYKSEYRLAWSPLEARLGRLDEITISASLPYSDSKIISQLLKNISELGHLQAPFIDQLLYMSQRTHLCSLRASDLLYLLSQSYKFFIAYLQTSRIGAVVSTEIPHHVTDYVFALACKTIGIPFVSQINQGLTHNAFFLDFTKQEYLANPSSYGVSDTSRQDITKYLLKHSPSQRKTSAVHLQSYDPAGSYLSNLTDDNIKSFLKSGNDESKAVIDCLYKSAYSYDLLCSQKPIPSCVNGVSHYFFAHLQPEATTSPMCGSLADHRHCLSELAKQIKADDIIVYKEHPMQFRFLPLMNGSIPHIENVYAHKSPQFYASIACLDRVFLAPRTISTQDVFNMTNVKIWSPNGTVSLEAYLANKPMGFFNTCSPWKGLGSRPISSSNRQNDRSGFACQYLHNLSWPIIISDTYLASPVDYSKSFVFTADSLGSFLVALLQQAKLLY